MASNKRKTRQANFNIVIARNIRADGWLKKYRLQMNIILDKQTREVSRAIGRGASVAAWQKRFTKKWERELRNGKRDMILDMVVDGYILALEDFPDIIEKPKGKDWIDRIQGKATAVDIAIAESQLSETRLRADVEKYINETSKIETATSAKKYAAYHTAAIEEGLTIREVARRVLDNGLAVNKSRAMLMARTTTIWAYNEGATEMYKDAGVGAMEWIATLDELTAEDDAAADGEQQVIGKNFSTGVIHPPAHPNCRCSVVPVVDASQVLTAEQEIARQEERVTEIEERRAARRKTPSKSPPKRESKPKRKPVVRPKPRLKPAQPEPKKFEPAKTRDEAIRRLGNHANTVSLKNVPLDSLNDMLQASDDVLGKFNVKIDRMGLTRANSRSLGQTLQGKVSKKLEIDINPHLTTNPKAIAEEGKKLWTANKTRLIKDRESLISRDIAALAKKPKPAVRIRLEGDLNRQRNTLKKLKATEHYSTITASSRPVYAAQAHESYHAVAFQHNLDNVFIKELGKRNALSGLGNTEYAASNAAELFAETGASSLIGLPINSKIKAAFDATIRSIK